MRRCYCPFPSYPAVNHWGNIVAAEPGSVWIYNDTGNSQNIEVYLGADQKSSKTYTIPAATYEQLYFPQSPAGTPITFKIVQTIQACKLTSKLGTNFTPISVSQILSQQNCYTCIPYVTC